MKRFYKYTIAIITGLIMLSCSPKTVYVPIETVKEIAVHDTTYLHRTDTLVQIPETTIADYINVADTLRLEAPYALSTAWVDTTLGILKGRLVQGGKLPVQVVEKERIVTKDSIVYQDHPYPVEVEKIKKIVPGFWRFFGIFGIFSLAALVLLILVKLGVFKRYV